MPSRNPHRFQRRSASEPPSEPLPHSPRLRFYGLLLLAWLMSLVLIWGALREIVDLRPESLPDSGSARFNPVSFLEMLAALALGCGGLSLLMTVTLKQNAQRSSKDPDLTSDAKSPTIEHRSPHP